MAKSDVLFVTDAECAARIGLPTQDFKDALPALERTGFPPKDPLFNNKRYWPAIQAFLDKRSGLASSFQRRNPAPLKEAAKGPEVW
ncbi:winged helix-turn-helix domain-containing protein [Rhizobium sp. BT-226]|uniref:winged helix-turn-helix domain-containing protein n=1 Tax=Rhizobium sp. BT-226 TaxID=2986922 RepID=UPI0021F77EE4|nr:winged helix-turn-helix domain-containing protein [Rhizobium sp. BT-226]MCW0016258.1 winged helix-turn-helix domain-containing protein [Rhizobium sp. BT-226]